MNPLIGATTEPTRICTLSLYCTKGSLQDVLENDNIKLDRIFKVSFASDIAKVRTKSEECRRIGISRVFCVVKLTLFW